MLHDLRWRCWDCRVDLCASCANDGNGKHGACLKSEESASPKLPQVGKCVGESILIALIHYANRPFLAIPDPGAPLPITDFVNNPKCGARNAHQPNFKETRSPFTWVSYRSMLRRMLNFQHGLEALDIFRVGDEPVNAEQQSIRMMAICSKNRLDHAVADLACYVSGIVQVPIHPTSSPKEISHMIDNSQCQCLVVSADLFDTFAALSEGTSLHTIIVMPNVGKANKKRYKVNMHAGKGKSLRMLRMEVVEEAGEKLVLTSTQTILKQRKENGTNNDKSNSITSSYYNDKNEALAYDPELFPVPAKKVHTGDGGSLLKLLYTSGSTGAPKGVMINDQGWNKSMLSSRLTRAARDVPAEVCFRGLGHANGSRQLLRVLLQGGQLCLLHFEGERATDTTQAATDADSLFSHMRAFRPTAISAVPQIWNAVYQRFNVAVEAASAQNKGDKEAVLTNFSSNFFGNRVGAASTGSAPISAEVFTFIKEAFGASEAYGSTETGNICVSGMQGDVSELRLRDVPEYNFFTTDKPYPRGEVCVRSEYLALGYYRDPDRTAEAWLSTLDEASDLKEGADASDVKEGADRFMRDSQYRVRNRSKTKDQKENGDRPWFATGDVGMIVEGGKLVLIDRRKNFFKLSQGMYVSAGKIEKVLDACSCIEQIFVFGSPTRSYLVAVVVPTVSFLETQASDEVLLQSLADTGRQAGLLENEIPKRVFMEDPSCSFTIKNGLLTPSGKLQRPALKQHYSEELEGLYAGDLTVVQRVEHKDGGPV